MIKLKLYSKCLELLQLQIEKYQREIEMIKEALEVETMPSEGDDGGKGELLNELEKYAGYIENTEKTREQLKRIDISQTHQFVGNGSLVETENNFFFIAVALGKLDIDDNKNYYSISTDAPIYIHLRGKKAGDSFTFNNLTYHILNVF